MRQGQNRLSWLSSWRRAFFAVALCAALCLAVGLNSAPKLYPVDYGQYELMLAQCGLTWTDADLEAGGLQYERPLTTFRYTRFAWSNLLTPGTGNSLVYPVAIVRLFTQPFGRDFSVDALAAVFAVLLAIATGLLSMALYDLGLRAWAVPGALLCALFTDGNFVAMFRGLYPQGSAAAFALLFAAIALRAWSLPAERRARWLPAVCAASALLLRAMTPLVVLAPLMIAVDAALALSCRRPSPLAVAAGVLILLTGVQGALNLAADDPDYFSEAASYESAFNTMLPASQNPSALLAELGLDDSYLADVGRSFYEDESVYAHDPRDEAQAEALFEKLTPGAIVKTYLRHPELLTKVLRGLPVSMQDGFESARNRTLSANDAGFSATRAGSGLLAWLWKLFPLNAVALTWLYALAALVFLALAVARRQKRWLLIVAFTLGCAAYLPLCAMLNGYALCQIYMQGYAFLALVWVAGALLAAVEAAPSLRQWFTRYSDEPYAAPGLRSRAGTTASSALSGRIAARALDGLAGSRMRLVLATAVAATVMLVMTFAPASHPASVNNGDFGRMMEQMDLTWTGDVYFNTDIQAGHYAIEEYAYMRPFDPLKLTPLKPTYSLYVFASIVRLFTQPFGLPFSTLLLSWVMGAVTVLAILVLVNDLYPLLGRWTALAAFLLCAMLLSETYLTWFNSLFGEGCILTGFVMTMACAVHLCMMPRVPSWRRLAWQIGLAVSLYVLLGAKSQMLTALPGALALMLALGFYQRPYRYDLQALQVVASLAFCAALILSSIGVYQSDRTSDSVSQKHTMWQAYFYGIFMISDDPIGDMEALGIDTAMAPDIGKFVQFSEDAEYVYAPLSDEAQTAFYDHVNTFTIIKWYLTHPLKLWRMLDHASGESQKLYTGFRVYAGQDYAAPDCDEVSGRNLWPGWRACLTPSRFIGYVLLYGLLLALLVRDMLRRDVDAQRRALCCIPLFILLTAALQFPLSVLGNGFADNQKQLFCFSLCHDFLLAGALVLGARWLSGRPRLIRHERKRENEKGHVGLRHAAGGDQNVPAGEGAGEER